MKVTRAAFHSVSAFVIAFTFAASAAAADPGVPDPVTIPAKLTLPVAVSMFREHGLDLLIADATVLSARADERTAAAIANPTLTAGIGKSFGNACEGQGPGCSSLTFQAGLADNAAITDILFGKHTLRKKVAEIAVESAKMDRLDAQRTFELPLKQQFVQAALAKASLDLSKDVQETSMKTQQLVGVRFKAGAVSEADLARVDTAKLEADQAVDTSLQSLREAKVGLAMLLGARTLVPEYEVDDTFIHHPITEPLDESNREALLHEALERRPDLKSIDLQKKHAEATISLEKRERIPDIGVWANYAQEGVGVGAISPPTLTLGISTPLPIFYQNQGAIAKAEADRLTQSLERAKLEAQVVNNIEASLNAYVFAQHRLQRMESSLLERARRARELVGIQYEKGAASLLELLDAQRTLIATNVEYLQDLTDYWTAVFQIEQAVGRELHR